MSELERRHYRLLLEIDRRHTISAAARALHITQSAASQQLREAERRLGFSLTRPSGRSITLTPAANRLVAAAEAGEQIWSAAEANARWLASALGDTCQVAVGVYDDASWLARLQADLDAVAGAAPIEAVRAPDTYGFALITTGSAHVAVAPTRPPATYGRTVELGDDDLVGVVGTNHPLAARTELHAGDFADTDYVTYSTTPEHGYEHDTFFAPAGVVPATITRIESTTTIVEMIAATRRVSVMCRRAVPEHAGVRVLPLSPGPAPRPWTMTITDATLPASVETTIDRIAGHWMHQPVAG